MRFLGVAVALLALTACSSEPGVSIPPQQWKDFEIRVESRPPIPQPGMNEFLVIATETRGRPVHDLVVSLRASEDKPWRQAIQDGLSGVYRRALPVQNPQTQRLTVQLRQGTDETVLSFPLSAASTD